MNGLKRLGFLNRAGMTACREGRYGDALFQLTQANTIAEALDSPLHIAKIRNNLGIVHQMSGNEQQARICFRLAARIAKEQVGTETGFFQAINRNLEGLETNTRELQAA